ncbi:MAG: type II secretion system F family protein [Methanosarcinales archaeon]|jgi:flagellar protein FlaJ|nr:type II secretion system F family protein [Methanosarcinales archaeon]
MNREFKTDDDFSILKKMKRREKYGSYADFLKNPFRFFEQNPLSAFIPGLFCSAAILLLIHGVVQNPGPAERMILFLTFRSAETILLLTAFAFFLPFIYFEEKRQKKIETAEEKLPDFLHGLSDLISGGLTLQEALTEISKSSDQMRLGLKKNKGSFFDTEIKLIGLKMKSGLPFDACLDRFGKRHDSKLIQRAASVISAAEKSGGFMHLSIDAAVFDIREAVNLKKERDSKQSVYGIVLFLSFLLFVGIAVLLIRQFSVMSALASQSNVLETAGASALLIYRMLLIQAFFSGLMAGKLRKGKAAAGLKYAFLMMSAVWISFAAGGVFEMV